jgi:hypothetical protein
VRSDRLHLLAEDALALGKHAHIYSPGEFMKEKTTLGEEKTTLVEMTMHDEPLKRLIFF